MPRRLRNFYFGFGQKDLHCFRLIALLNVLCLLRVLRVLLVLQGIRVLRGLPALPALPAPPKMVILPPVYHFLPHAPQHPLCSQY